jgi:hypothetical protein
MIPARRASAGNDAVVDSGVGCVAITFSTSVTHGFAVSPPPAELEGVDDDESSDDPHAARSIRSTATTGMALRRNGPLRFRWRLRLPSLGDTHWGVDTRTAS